MHVYCRVETEKENWTWEYNNEVGENGLDHSFPENGHLDPIHSNDYSLWTPGSSSTITP